MEINLRDFTRVFKKDEVSEKLTAYILKCAIANREKKAKAEAKVRRLLVLTSCSWLTWREFT